MIGGSFTGGMMNGGFMHGGFNGGPWWVGLIGMVINLLFWGAIIFLAIRLIRNVSFRSCKPWQNNRPLDILKERYAKGEIDTDEFNTRKKELES